MARKKIYQPHLSTASDARAVRTREALRSAMLKLLENKTLDQITIGSIVKKAGIGYTTFFRHYPSKESLLQDLAAEEVRHLVSLSLPMMGGVGLGDAAITLCRYVNAHRSLWSTLLTGGAAGAVREEFLNLARRIAQSQKWPKSWLPADAGIVLIVSGVVELLTWWLRQTKPLSIKKVAEILDRIVVAPVMTANKH